MNKFHKSGLVVVSMGPYEPWLTILRNGQCATWLDVARPNNIEVVHFHGVPVGNLGTKLDVGHEKLRWKSRLSGRALTMLDILFFSPLIRFIPKFRTSSRFTLKDLVFEVKIPDMYPTVKWKELAYFKYFVEQNTGNYLIVTTNSSYLNLMNLSKFLETLPASGVYCGAEPYHGAKFLSGSFRIFSRDVVKIILEKRHKWNPGLLEDVAIGRLLASNGISLCKIPIYAFDQIEDINKCSSEVLQNAMHFRLKSGTQSERNDVELMKHLHASIHDKG